MVALGALEALAQSVQSANTPEWLTQLPDALLHHRLYLDILLVELASNAVHLGPGVAHSISKILAEKAVDGEIRGRVEYEQEVGPLVPVAERHRAAATKLAERVYQVNDQVRELADEKEQDNGDQHEGDVDLVAFAQAQVELATSRANERQDQEVVHDRQDRQRDRVRHNGHETHVDEEAVVPVRGQSRLVQVDPGGQAVLHNHRVVLEPEGQAHDEAGEEHAEDGAQGRARVIGRVALARRVHNDIPVDARAHGQVDRAELKCRTQRIQIREHERVEFVVEQRAVTHKQVTQGYEKEHDYEREEIRHGQAGQKDVGRVGAHARLEEDLDDEHVADYADNAHEKGDPAEQDVLVLDDVHDRRWGGGVVFVGEIARRRGQQQLAQSQVATTCVGVAVDGRGRGAELEQVVRLENVVEEASVVPRWLNHALSNRFIYYV